MFNKTILSTAYLPNAEYFRHILNGNEVLIEVYDTYQKQTWRNRCTIVAANGKLDLIIPVIKVFGNHTHTSEIIIDNTQKWQLNHWRAMESAYKKSPFFIYYEDLLKPFYCELFDGKLIEWNSRLLKAVLSEFKIKNDIKYTESFILQYDNALDLRNSISPKNKISSGIKNFPKYTQVFHEKHGFVPNMSIVDMIFNLGPDLPAYMMKIE